MLKPAMMALVVLTGAPALAQQQIDATSVDACETVEGQNIVLGEFITAKGWAENNGRLGPAQQAEVDQWLQAALYKLSETNDTRGFCREAIAVRQRYGF